MTTQNYLVVENNVVTNIIVWDGGSDWIPPTDATMLIQATTPAMVWLPVVPATTPKTWSLQQVIGAGDIGFTWNGSVLTTNQPQPTIPTAQPSTTGTKVA